MTRQIGTVLVRLAAVFLLIRAIQGLGYFAPLVDQPGVDFGDFLFPFALTVLVPLAAAALLWSFPATVARFGPDDEFPGASPDALNRNILLAGVSLLGLYALIFGIVELVRVESAFAAQSLMNDAIGADSSYANQMTISARLTYGVQIVLGLVLMVGRSTVTRWLHKAKYGGLGPS